MIDLAQTNALFFHPIEGNGNGIHCAHPIPIATVAERRSFVGAHGFIGVHPFKNGRNGKREVLGEFPVSFVSCWDGHDGTCAVTCKHVVGNPNRDQIPRDRMHDMSAGEDARYGFVALTVALRFHASRFDVRLNFGALGRGRELIDEFVFGSKHHESDPTKGVWAGGEDFDLGPGIVRLAFVVGQCETDDRSFGTPNPMTLCLFDAVRPFEVVEAVQESIRIRCDAHHPLAHGFLHHGVTAAFAQAVFDFVVGEDRAECRTPVDLAVGQIRDAEAHQHLGALASLMLCQSVAVNVPSKCAPKWEMTTVSTSPPHTLH